MLTRQAIREQRLRARTNATPSQPTRRVPTTAGYIVDRRGRQIQQVAGLSGAAVSSRTRLPFTSGAVRGADVGEDHAFDHSEGDAAADGCSPFTWHSGDALARSDRCSWSSEAATAPTGAVAVARIGVAGAFLLATARRWRSRR